MRNTLRRGLPALRRPESTNGGSVSQNAGGISLKRRGVSLKHRGCFSNCHLYRAERAMGFEPTTFCLEESSGPWTHPD